MFSALDPFRVFFLAESSIMACIYFTCGNKIMKNYIVTSAVALALMAVFAEARDISSGTMMVTGDTNMDISSNEISASGLSTTTDSTRTNITGASFNYLLNDNVSASVGLRVVNADVDLSSGGFTTSADLDETGVSIGMSLFI